MAFSYVWSELRHRLGRTLVTALGLAAGVSLVMAIIGVSAGVSRAQNKVLSPLSSVGTDLMVTRTVAPTTSTSPAPSTSPSSGGTQNFLSQANNLDDADQNALLAANSTVLTDLSKLGPPGTKFTHDFFVPGTLITFGAKAASTISHLDGVTSAVGALTLSTTHETGTVPKIVASISTGSHSYKATTRPPAPTAAQLAAAFSCFHNAGALAGGGKTGASGRTPVSSSVFLNCLPPTYRSYVTNVVVPAETIHQVIQPPSTDTKTSTYTVGGVDPRDDKTGLVTRAQLTKGHWYDANSAREVLVDSAYATTHKLQPGDRLTINGTTFSIIGLVAPTLTGNVADLYFDLSTLQSISSNAQRINEVLVSVHDASQVAAVTAEIKKALPGAQVLTAKDLADQVTGSLANAHKLANDLGGALAVVVLLAGFAIAGLLTLSNITKRVREIGSLRAMGWSRGLVVRQILAETVSIGVLGGLLGIALGALICGFIDLVGPSLSVTSSGLRVGASAASSLFNQSNGDSVTGSVSLNAPIEASAVILGFLGALVGGVLAGAVGGWRAARLAPVDALRDLG